MKLECTQDACSPLKVDTQLTLLKEFPRTFNWEFKAPEKTAVSLLLLEDSLIETSQPCPNGLQYSVATSDSDSKGQTQYCQGGSVTQFDLLNQAVMSLQVKPNAPVTSVLFQTSARPLSKNLLNQNLSKEVLLVSAFVSYLLHKFKLRNCVSLFILAAKLI